MVSAANVAAPDDARTEAARRLVGLLDGALTGRTDANGPAADWLRSGGGALQFKGGRIAYNGVDCGALVGDLGGWAKRLADAGVRAIGPQSTLDGEGLMALANATKSSDADHLMSLRNWLWCGGPIGLRITLGPTIWQLPARLGYGLEGRKALDEVRNQAVARQTANSTTPWKQALALIATAGAGDRQLRYSGDDATAWIENCLMAYVKPPLDDPRQEPAGQDPAPAPPAKLLAGAVREQVMLSARFELETLWSGLPEHDSAIAAPLRAEISVHDMGVMVGRATPLDSARVQELESILASAGDFAEGVASGLLQRAVDKRSVAGVGALLQRLGLKRVWEMADIHGIGPTGARGLAMVLKQLDASATQWADLIGAAPPQIAAWILKGSPPHILSRVGSQLRMQLIERPPADTAPLVQALIEMNDPTTLRAVGEALRDTAGKGWSGRLVPAVCQALIDQHMGRELLVPLFLNEKAETALRLLVLRSLDAEPALLEEAVKFRFGELREPAQIQARVKAARKKLKGSK